jgi:hypothetical protein
MRLFLFSLIATVSMFAFASKSKSKHDSFPAEAKRVTQVPVRADDDAKCITIPTKLEMLCSYVADQTKDPSPLAPRYKYMYQRRILEASCVDVGKDSEETIAKKVSSMWSQFEDKLFCDSTQFGVIHGSLLKFGAVSKNDRFIIDIVDWKVPLNKVDRTDGRTLLDYVRDEMKRNKGNALEPILQGYYDELREAGAKHRSEL